MARNIKNEKIDNIIKSNIIPDIDKLVSKEYQTDEEVLQALNELEEKWSKLDIPTEYEESFNMLISNNCLKEDIFKMLPYIHIYIYVMKVITYLFFQNSKFDTEISLLSSLNQICLDKAENKTVAKYIMEHINYIQDIAMAKDETNEKIIISAYRENAENFKKESTSCKV